MAHSNKQRKALACRINTLGFMEHEEIFNIIKRTSTVTYTTNKNGVFFNLSCIEDPVIEQIESFVEFCYANKEELDEYDKHLNECKANANVINVNLGDIVEVVGTADKSLSVVCSDWEKVAFEQTIESKHVQHIMNFIEKMTGVKCNKKKMNVKFHNAKKKYSKKIVTESKFDFDYGFELHLEEYPPFKV